MRLQIARVIDAYKRFRASISTISGSPITSQIVVPASSQSITLNLPASLFSSGEYVFRLDGISNKGKPEEVNKYFFRVEKKAKSN